MQYICNICNISAIAIKNRNELEGDADEDGWDFWTGNESSLIFTFSFAFEEDEWESLFLNLSLYHCCGWLALEGRVGLLLMEIVEDVM